MVSSHAKKNLKVAILIVGHLRDMRTNLSKFQYLANMYDIFIVTNKSYASDARCIDKLIKVRFIEDDLKTLATEKSLSTIAEGNKMLQWYKLYLAFLDMEDHESKIDKKYDLVYKFRTDIEVKDLFIDIDLHHSSDKYIFMYTDWCFGGKREMMKNASNFFFRIFLDYYGTNRSYWPINYICLRESNIKAAKIDWLNYPESIVGEFNPKMIGKKISSNISELIDYEFKDGDRLTSGMKFECMFSSEKSFAHYLLSCGYVIQFLFEDMKLTQARKNAAHELSVLTNKSVKLLCCLRFKRAHELFKKALLLSPLSLKVNLLYSVSSLLNMKFKEFYLHIIQFFKAFFRKLF